MLNEPTAWVICVAMVCTTIALIVRWLIGLAKPTADESIERRLTSLEFRANPPRTGSAVKP